MKHTRHALVLLATSLAATPAFAASVTMLQFGSFETRAEAEKRLNEITKKHADAISKLGSTIREVKLPPDNLTVYRTQAGPVETRAAAQAICATLSGAGDECYIVQTAMTTSTEAAKPVAAVATPSTAEAAKPAAAAAPVEAAAAAAVKDAKTELAQATPLKDDLTSKLSTLSKPTVRDEANVKALESVTAPKLDEVTPKTEAPVAPTLAEPSPEMKSALDKAASEQAAAEASVKQATESVKKPRASFWSRLNPFSSDDEDVKPAAPAVKAPEATAAPVQAVTSQTLEAPAVVIPAVEKPAAPIAEVVAPQPSAPVVAALAPQTMPSALPTPSISTPAMPVMDATPVITQAEPLRLPPPPAPLKARDRELLAAARDAKPSAAPAPTQTGTLQPIDVKPLPPANGTVQVEEAKRVPVTSATVTPTPASPAPVAVTPVAPPLQPPVSLNPSATDGMKTIWAQIGPFADNDAALAYWANYRQANPDFPVVRVRVTTPLAQQVRGSSQSWLRVGPVTRTGFVKVLCASVVTPTSKLRCGTVADMGVSSFPKSQKGILPASRYSR